MAVTDSVQRLLVEATRILTAAGIATGRREAEWILMHTLGWGRAEIYAHQDHLVDQGRADLFQGLIERRRRREPLQYVLGEAEFMGLRLRVEPGVLIPRPETEELVEAALRLAPAEGAIRVLDIGTGSGCIALSIKARRPMWDVTACDVSPDALAVAASNVSELGLDIRLLQADVLAPSFPEEVEAPFALVVSNPPYVSVSESASLQPEVVDFEPHVALFAGEDPLRFYRAIGSSSRRLLDPGGLLLLECHADHAHEVASLLEALGLAAVQTARDLAGHPRIVTARCPAG